MSGSISSSNEAASNETVDIKPVSDRVDAAHGEQGVEQPVGPAPAVALQSRTDESESPSAMLPTPAPETEAKDAVGHASPFAGTDAPDDALPPDPLLNTVLGKCMLQRRIGEGGMGAVYLGKHLTLDVEVAIKVLPAALAKRDRGFVDRFLREARTAARVHHPNIVQVLDVDFQKGHYFIVMEYVKGETVGERLRRKHRLSEREVLEIGLDIAAALEYARRKSIIHRDIKPENILISNEGEVKISDLGLAKRLAGEAGSDLTLGDQVIGTPFYISPEQATSAKKADHRSDLYSLGATLFHLATGRPPFQGTSAFDTMSRHLNEPAPELRAYRAELSVELAGIVKQLLAKDPNQRFQSAGGLLLALHELYERVVPKAERDKALAGTANGPGENTCGIQPASNLDGYGPGPVARLTRIPQGVSQNEMAPTPLTPPAPPNPIKVKILDHPHRSSVAAAGAPRVRPAAPSQRKTPLPTLAFDEDEGLFSAPGNPSRLWLMLLLLPFLNGLAYLWIGSRSRKREWIAWGLVFMLFQGLFLIFWAELFARIGLGLVYFGAIAYGWTIRREYALRVSELETPEGQA